MMSYKNELIVLVEIEVALASLTEQDKERAERQLAPATEKDKHLGLLHDAAVRDIYALGYKFQGQFAALMLDAAYKANSEDEKKSLTDEAARCMRLSEFCKELFWIHARHELGAWETSGIGIRAGWELVVPEDKSQTSLRKLFGIGGDERE